MGRGKAQELPEDLWRQVSEEAQDYGPFYLVGLPGCLKFECWSKLYEESMNFVLYALI